MVPARYIISFFFILKASFCFAQSETQLVKKLKPKYKYIQQWLEKESRSPDSKIYEQCTSEDETQEDVSTGTIEYYYHGEELRYIHHYHEPNTSESIDTGYYFWDNELFFCLQTSSEKYQQNSEDEVEGEGEGEDKGEGEGEVSNHIKVEEKKIYYTNRTPSYCFAKENELSQTGEGIWPDENPFNKLDSIPSKKVSCDMTLEKINDITYYIALLELNEAQLQEKCMTRDR